MTPEQEKSFYENLEIIAHNTNEEFEMVLRKLIFHEEARNVALRWLRNRRNKS